MAMPLRAAEGIAQLLEEHMASTDRLIVSPAQASRARTHIARPTM